MTNTGANTRHTGRGIQVHDFRPQTTKPLHAIGQPRPKGNGQGVGTPKGGVPVALNGDRQDPRWERTPGGYPSLPGPQRAQDTPPGGQQPMDPLRTARNQHTPDGTTYQGRPPIGARICNICKTYCSNRDDCSPHQDQTVSGEDTQLPATTLVQDTSTQVYLPPTPPLSRW
jgi:hypothetical protein